MASVTKKTCDVVYVLELSEREANALCELLVAASLDGEGEILDGIYCQLHSAGCESNNTEHEIDKLTGLVTVTRSP